MIALELVLGIDNIVFISILSGKLPPEQSGRARTLGISLALITRLLLLFSITWIMGLEATLFAVAGFEVSGRDLILAIGGLFLIYKSVREIHHKVEGGEDPHRKVKASAFWSVVGQILIIDMVFSLDSVVTAVGMVEHLSVMVISVLVSVVFMLVAAKRVSDFIEKHPTLKMLALAFLVLIGVNLLAEAFHQHIPRGYTYFAMAFAIGVEMLNLRVRPKNLVPSEDLPDTARST